MVIDYTCSSCQKTLTPRGRAIAWLSVRAGELAETFRPLLPDGARFSIDIDDDFETRSVKVAAWARIGGQSYALATRIPERALRSADGPIEFGFLEDAIRGAVKTVTSGLLGEPREEGESVRYVPLEGW